MKPSEIFLRAAKRIVSTKAEWLASLVGDNNLCCCDAIAAAGNFPLDDAAQELFASIYRRPGIYWWSDPFVTDADQEARRLALLFAHHYAKDMGQ